MEPIIICLTGVSGTGKTTLSKSISSKISEIKYIPSGEIKGPLSKIIYNKSLSLLDQNQSYFINDLFFNKISHEHYDYEGILLVDTHLTYPFPEERDGFVRLISNKSLEKISGLIVVTTDSSSVLHRRNSRGRDRDSISLKYIELELLKEYEEAKYIKEKTNIDVEFLLNNEEVTNSVNRLEKLLERFINFQTSAFLKGP